MIRRVMAEAKVKGNPRDFVVVAGDTLTDCAGAHGLTSFVEGVNLVHKRDLHKVIGEERAARFWSRRYRMRTQWRG